MAINLYKRREPFGLLRDFETDIDRWFGSDWFRDDLFTDRFFTKGFEGSWKPAVDIEEKDGKLIMKAELPGVNKEDIHVEVKDGYLNLRGARNLEHEDRDKGYHRIERSFGSFERSFVLPEGVTAEDIHAHYKDGVLELIMSVHETPKPKAIEIKVE
jgi:HSP20 family protein